VHRLLLLVIALAACSARSTGPAWPKPREPEPGQDGGESIAPRAGATATAIEKAAEPTPKDDDKPVEVAAKPAGTPADATATPVATPPATPQPDDVIITTEEIVIEVDD
jgi:hypothetical protein